uniref:Complex I assembly factor TIMMDC1, mitochondrial n=1 Tax=Strix occidentalis caurina TaxID=311401 RepID=A0A8D0EF71_STROC
KPPPPPPPRALGPARPGAFPLPPCRAPAMAEGVDAQPQFGSPAPPPQTGWERLSELWRLDERRRYPEEMLNIVRSAVTGGVVGWLYGGLPAFQQARKAFIARSHGELFHNRADAVQSAHRAGLRSFIRYGWRWSWRVAVFVTIFNISLCLYVMAGGGLFVVSVGLWFFLALTGAIFRMHLGLQGLAGGFVFGTAFGIPAGGLLIIMQKLTGETLQEKRNRDRRELYEQKLVEWQSRLSVTEVLGQMESDELLSLPHISAVSSYKVF